MDVILRTMAVLLASLQIASSSSCDATQCADYVEPVYWPPMGTNPVLAIETVYTVHKVDRYNKGSTKGVYSAHTISTRGENGQLTASGYFGTVIHSKKNGGYHGDMLLFSIWDRGETGHALPMHTNCRRNCEDCSRADTTGTQCKVDIGFIPDGQHLKFRMERGRWASASYAGRIRKGYVWTVTATGFWNGVIGKILYEESAKAVEAWVNISGITGIGMFHEILWDAPCTDYHVVESRDGPYPVDPQGVDDDVGDLVMIPEDHHVQSESDFAQREELLNIDKVSLKHAVKLIQEPRNITPNALGDAKLEVYSMRQGAPRQFLYLPALRTATAFNHYTRGIKAECRAPSSVVCRAFNFYSDRPGRSFIATGGDETHKFDDYVDLHLYDCPAGGCQIPWKVPARTPLPGKCSTGEEIADKGDAPCSSGSRPYGSSRKYTTCCCGGGCCWDNCGWSSPPASCLPRGAEWQKGVNQWGKATQLACMMPKFVPGKCGNGGKVADKGFESCPSGSNSYSGSRSYSTCCCGAGCCWDSCSWSSPPTSCLPPGATWVKGTDQWGSSRSLACMAPSSAAISAVLPDNSTQLDSVSKFNEAQSSSGMAMMTIALIIGGLAGASLVIVLKRPVSIREPVLLG